MTNHSTEPMDGAAACGMMHTALRKVADSPITTVAYQIIHMICDSRITPRKFDPWLLFGQLVADGVNECAERGEELVNPYIICKLRADRIEQVFYERVKAHRAKVDGEWHEPAMSHHALYALTRTFKLFKREDWEAMAHYFLPDDEAEFFAPGPEVTS